MVEVVRTRRGMRGGSQCLSILEAESQIEQMEGASSIEMGECQDTQRFFGVARGVENI
jgi:hypothetical protein